MNLPARVSGLSAALLFVVSLAHAKTAGEVYEQAARSTVVVENINEKGKIRAIGSGVVFTHENVVTNCHVIEGASRLQVRIGDREHTATLRHSDWDRDICSLSVAGLSAQTVVVGSTKTLKVGARVYAVGAPKGLELTLSDGIVSSLREVEGGHYIQTNAAISPGSSGGGLFDENGALVGLTTFYLAEAQSLNFAVPVEWVKELATRSAKVSAGAQPVTQWLNRAMELESRKDWPALLENGRRWTKAQPESGMAWFSLGMAYDEAGQSANAIQAYLRALRISPGNAAGWLRLGRAYVLARQFAEAIEAHQRVLRLSPEDARAWSGLAVAYGMTGQHSKAIEACQQALRINPEDGRAWWELGLSYGAAGQQTKAIEACQQALRLNPEDDIAWGCLGLAYGATGHHAKAIEAYQQALRINPKYASVWYDLGILYDESGQRGKVLEVYARLKAVDPQKAEKFFNEVVMP